MCVWATRSLVRCKEEIEKNHAVAGMTYQDLTRMVLGKFPYVVVVASLICCQLGTCITYHIYVSRAVDGLVEGDVKHIGGYYSIVVLLLIPIFLSMLMIKDIKRLVPYLTVANFLIISVVIFIVTYGFINVCNASDTQPCGNVQEFQIWTLPITLGISTFAMEGVFVVLPVYDSMQDPRQVGQRTVGAGTADARRSLSACST